ncbi:MAG: 16S rRNA processing protein RimM [Gammaproteobacteria bacterium HGW-Gammaproteobacteria-8]|jgi:16S rRNA processing protein RimM|nr:MAG: 16S rRNA processing protein RimM [Gammaproteobacteria bacterium HGW-Gammaproteobacteria-8]
MTDRDAAELELGRISGAWGIAGWVRVHSRTEPPENIFDYQPWRSDRSPGLFHVEEWRRQGPRLVCRLREVADREAAEALTGTVLKIHPDQLPPAEPGHWYWSDLFGLDVLDAAGARLGTVSGLLDAGAHDVLQVDAADGGEALLIPFVLGNYVLEVDLEARCIRVDWELAWSREPD